MKFFAFLMVLLLRIDEIYADQFQSDHLHSEHDLVIIKDRTVLVISAAVHAIVSLSPMP